MTFTLGSGTITTLSATFFNDPTVEGTSLKCTNVVLDTGGANYYFSIQDAV